MLMLQWPNNITLLMFAHQWRVTAPEIEIDKSCTVSHLKYPNGSLFHDQTNFGMISQGPVSFVEFPNRWREIEMKSLRFNNKVAKRVLLKLVWQGRKRKREIEKIFGKKGCCQCWWLREFHGFTNSMVTQAVLRSYIVAALGINGWFVIKANKRCAAVTDLRAFFS